MIFDPSIHTKEYLVAYPDTAIALAERSINFALSHLANDIDIIKLADRWGDTVAHRLAKYQSAWVNTKAAESFEILKIANSNGETVAHWLAANQPLWIKTETAENLNILSLSDHDGETVAHFLARYQQQWIKSDASKNLEVLCFATKLDLTVAHILARKNPEWIHSEAAKNLNILSLRCNIGTVANVLIKNNKDCIYHDVLMHKQILTLDYNGVLLAESFYNLYKPRGFDVTFMALKLITQGAAYKHSKPIAIKSGEAILKQCKNLIEDGLDPLVSLKQLQALYSTFSHNVAKIISTQEQKSLQKWQGLLLQSENLIRQHLANNPDLYDIEHTIDIHCEPGDDLLQKLKSEVNLRSNLTSLDDLSNEVMISEEKSSVNFLQY